MLRANHPVSTFFFCRVIFAPSQLCARDATGPSQSAKSLRVEHMLREMGQIGQNKHGIPKRRSYDGDRANQRSVATLEKPKLECAMRVSQFLEDQHVVFETVDHPPAYTAQKRARVLHISGRQVVKCVLVAGADDSARFTIAVLPAKDHVDLNALGRHLEVPVRLASEAELAELFRDCEHGALTPFGSLYGIRTLLEESVDRESMIVFESQRHAMAIKMRCRDFEAMEKPRRCKFKLTAPARNRDA